MDYRDIEPQRLKDWFKTFAENECKGVSPMYFALSNKISEDDELITLASYCKSRQPMPNLFLASVQYLLFKEPSSELAHYYPSIHSQYKEDPPFALFKEFCLKRRDQIIELEQSRLVQTNSLNRCAYLMPIFSSYSRGEEVILVDIGTSAGLTLNMDRYAYFYDDVHTFGRSDVKIQSEERGGKMPAFDQMVSFRSKLGIDQNPLDLSDQNNVDWLRALVWADRLPRHEKISAAISLAQKENLQFEKASTIPEFERIIESQDDDAPLLVFHTHVLYQFSKGERVEFTNMMERIGSHRDLLYLAAEHSSVLQNDHGMDGVLVESTEFKKGTKSIRLHAQTNGHANWIKWN